MESIYFSLVLILLGVILGGGVAMSLLRGLSRSHYAQVYPAYPAQQAPLERSHGGEWWLGVGIFILAMVLLHTGKEHLKNWWFPEQALMASVQRDTSHSSALSKQSFHLVQATAIVSPTIRPDSVYVQIGAYHQRSSAEALQARWMRHGYPVTILKDHQNSNTLYKLCMGPYSHTQLAQKFMQKYPHLGGFIFVQTTAP